MAKRMNFQNDIESRAQIESQSYPVKKEVEEIVEVAYDTARQEEGFEEQQEKPKKKKSKSL